MARTAVAVVEDEGIVAEEVKDTLTRLGYDVPVVAATAEKALRGVLQTEVDLVLMDIRLKGSMDGIEAAERIRDSARIPVVFLTAYSDEATLLRAKECGALGFLVKPLEERALRAAIEIALSRAREERLFRSALDQLKDLVRSVPEGVLLADTKGLIELMNPAACALVGWEELEAKGMRVHEVLRILDSSRARHLPLPLDVPLAEGAVVRRESCALAARDGKTHVVDYSMGPLRKARGVIDGVIIVLRETPRVP